MFSSTLDIVAPFRLKKVREKTKAPWYNRATHAIKRETRNLERKLKQTNLEVFRIVWKDSMSHYKNALKTARPEHLPGIKKRVRGEKGEKHITPQGGSGGMVPRRKILNIPYFKASI